MIGRQAYWDAVKKDKRLTAAQRELLRVLLDQRGRNGQVEPHASELMDYFDLSQTAVYNRINQVIQNGYLREIGRDGRQRFYEMTLPVTEIDLETLEARIAKLEENMSEALELSSRIRELEELVRVAFGE